MGSCASVDFNASTSVPLPGDEDGRHVNVVAAEEEHLLVVRHNEHQRQSQQASSSTQPLPHAVEYRQLPPLQPSPPRHQSRRDEQRPEQTTPLMVETFDDGDDTSLTVSGASLPALELIHHGKQLVGAGRRNSAPATAVGFMLPPAHREDLLPFTSVVAGQQGHHFTRLSPTTNGPGPLPQLPVAPSGLRSANSSTSSSTRSYMRRNPNRIAATQQRPVPPPLALHQLASSAGALLTTTTTDEGGRPITLLTNGVGNSPRPSPSQHLRSPTTRRTRATVANPFRQPSAQHLDDDLSSSFNSQSPQQLAAASAVSPPKGPAPTSPTYDEAPEALGTMRPSRTLSSLDRAELFEAAQLPVPIPTDFFVAYNVSANSEDNLGMGSSPTRRRAVDPAPSSSVDLGNSSTTTSTSTGSGVWSPSLISPGDGLPYSPTRSYGSAGAQRGPPGASSSSSQHGGRTRQYAQQQQQQLFATSNDSPRSRQPLQGSAALTTTTISTTVVPGGVGAPSNSFIHLASHNSGDGPLANSLRGSTSGAVVQIADVAYRSVRSNSLCVSSGGPRSLSTPPSTPLATSHPLLTLPPGVVAMALSGGAAIPSPQDPSPIDITSDADGNASSAGSPHVATQAHSTDEQVGGATTTTEGAARQLITSNFSDANASAGQRNLRNLQQQLCGTVAPTTEGEDWWSVSPREATEPPPPSSSPSLAANSAATDDPFPQHNRQLPHQETHNPSVPSLAELAGLTGGNEDASHPDFATMQLYSTDTDEHHRFDDNRPPPRSFSIDANGTTMTNANSKSVNTAVGRSYSSSGGTANEFQSQLSRDNINNNSPKKPLPTQTHLQQQQQLSTMTVRHIPPAPPATTTALASSFSSGGALPYSSDAAAFFESGDWEAVPVVVVAKYKDQIAKPRGGDSTSSAGAIGLPPPGSAVSAATLSPSTLTLV